MLRVETPEPDAPERAYVLELVFGRWLGVPYERVEGEAGHVRVRHRDLPGVVEIPDLLLARGDGVALCRSRPKAPLKEANLTGTPAAAAVTNPRLPLLFPRRRLSLGAFWEQDENAIRLGADLLGGIFFLVARVEEWAEGDRDRHGRFPAASALPVEGDFVERPLADEYAGVLGAACKALWPGLEGVTRRATLHVSHDIDRLRATVGRPWRDNLRQAVWAVKDHRDLGLAVARLRSSWRTRSGSAGRDMNHTFHELMTESERRGLESTFLFIPASTNDRWDADYALEEPFVRDAARSIVRRGHRIGAHFSYGSVGVPDQIANEMTRITRLRAAAGADPGVPDVVVPGRQHYLRWHDPAAVRALESGGVTEDWTLGYAERAGFRCGTSRSFPIFDLAARRSTSVIARPLVAMDQTLVSYMGLSDGDAVDLVRRLAACCRRYGGTCTILWHNTMVVTRRQRRLYRRVLDAAQRAIDA